MTSTFCDNFRNQLRGKYDLKSTSIKTNELSGAAKIRGFFNEVYEEYSP